ncbi:MAG: glycosyltransferase family 4 protein [Actinomycetota bacterium]
MTEAFPRVLYIYKTGRDLRLDGNAFPSEFFFGSVELKARGLPVTWIEERGLLALAPRTVRVLRPVLRVLSALFRGFPVPLWTAVLYALGPVRALLNRADVVVATTQTFGMCLGLLRGLGVLRCRVGFIVMGALPLNLRPYQRRILRWCLSHCEPIAISRSEQSALAEALPGQPVHYLPFGVDLGFWAAEDAGTAAEPYVLSIGNDRNRDFATLVAAWRPEWPKLKIVTSLPVKAGQANIEVIRGDWRSRLLSDADIRTLFHQSLFVVIPLRQTIQPAGQSATLQAMACGKAVVVSDIEGMWDREAMRDDATCLLVPPGSGEGLAAAAGRLMDADTRARLAAAGREVIVTRLNTAVMATAMDEILRAIAAGRAPYPLT